MSVCNLCPRKCGVDRKDRFGYCSVGEKVRVARASLHLWEEPCISGQNGSGTVFFTGCNLGCVYCQNRKISSGNCGRELTENQLSKVFLKLQEKGAHNINLVTPTHFVLPVISAVKLAKDNGLSIPIVYNTSGYETKETIRAMNGIVDIYLTDFKYMSSDLSKRYSFAPNYPEVTKAALYEMVSQTGSPFINENGLMESGVIVRHLVLPNNTDDSKAVIEYLYKTYGNTIFISIMNQFTPLENLENYPEINRKITDKEYNEVVDFALSLGVENAFIQEGETQSESFIPDFDCGEIMSEII